MGATSPPLVLLFPQTIFKRVLEKVFTSIGQIAYDHQTVTGETSLSQHKTYLEKGLDDINFS